MILVCRQDGVWRATLGTKHGRVCEEIWPEIYGRRGTETYQEHVLHLPCRDEGAGESCAVSTAGMTIIFILLTLWGNYMEMKNWN